MSNVVPLVTDRAVPRTGVRARRRGGSSGGGSGSADPDQPVIRLGVELERNVDDAVLALQRDPNLYSRDGALVGIVQAEEKLDGAPLAGVPIVRRLSIATLRERLSSHARCEKLDKRSDAWLPTLASDHLVCALADRGTWAGIRPLIGVLEAPALRPDGSIIDQPGYDAATGYVFAPKVAFPDLPVAPDQQDATRALAELAEVFVDFPYRSEADRSVPIAAILTYLARPAIRGSIPAFVFDASLRGSGKGLQSDAVAIVVTGRSTAKMNYPKDEAELEKVLAGYALRGAALLNFDNVTGTFGGGPLDRCITSDDAVELRILGKNEIPVLKWRALIIATGNNLSFSGDTTRRVLHCRLESQLEQPEERSEFLHPELLEWVGAERPRLVVAALTILRAFHLAGRPACGKPWGSFEAWARLIPRAIVFAGGADPMATRPSLDPAADADKRALASLLDGWVRLEGSVGGGGLSVKNALDAVYPVERLRGEAPPDGFDEFREAIETLVHTPAGKMPNATKLGYALRSFRRRFVGGRAFDTRPGRAGSVRWTVVGAGSESE